MKICENCRAELNDDAIFCSTCGTKVSETKLPEEKTNEPEQFKTSPSLGETNKPTPSKKNVFIIAGVVVAVLIVALLIAVLNKPQTPVVETIKIPDVVSLDESTAKTLLAQKGLIPKVEYMWHNDIAEGNVVKTYPVILSEVEEDSIVTIYISKGPRFYYLDSAVGRMWNVTGIEAFDWEEGTKGFYTPYVEEGYLCIEMYLCCVSDYSLKFYGDFGTASINDTFDKTVPIDVIYDSQYVNNSGGKTSFTVKIPLKDLGVQKPTNMYIEFDFVVDGDRETFKASFDLSW